MSEIIRFIGVLSMVLLTWKIMFFAKELFFNSYEVLIRDDYFEKEFYGEAIEAVRKTSARKTPRPQRTHRPVRHVGEKTVRQRPVAAASNAERYTSYASYEDFRKRNKNVHR